MPATMVNTEVIRNAVRLACRAPSLHNSQPWRWVVEGDTLQLFADPDRIVRSTDRSGREAVSAFNDSPFQPGSAFPCRNNVCGSRNPLKKASDNLIKLHRYYNNRAGKFH